MKINGKAIVKIGAGLGSIIAAGAGLLLAKKTGELSSEDKDMCKLSPLGEDDDDVIGDEIVVMEPENVEETEEEDEDEDEDEE